MSSETQLASRLTPSNYRVCHGFRVKKLDDYFLSPFWPLLNDYFLSPFWPLLNRESILEATWTVVIIGLNIKSNHIIKFSLPKSVKHSVEPQCPHMHTHTHTHWHGIKSVCNWNWRKSNLFIWMCSDVTSLIFPIYYKKEEKIWGGIQSSSRGNIHCITSYMKNLFAKV